jgi:hypothetical protein
VSPAAAPTMAKMMSEAQLQEAVRKLAKAQGWLFYHPYDSRRSTPGYPDLTLVHRSGLVLFRELKAERGYATPEQKVWLSALVEAGADAAIWKPRDFYSGRIQAEMTPRFVASNSR